MGADLIGYLLKGPEKVEINDVQRQTAEVKVLRAQQFVEAYQNFEEEKISEEEMLSAWEYVRHFCSQYDEPDLFHGHFCSLEADLGESCTVDGWVEWWNDGCPARDSTCRIDPDDEKKQIVFAGDMSWGDSPDGFAYRMFEWLDILDWYGCFGIE